MYEPASLPAIDGLTEPERRRLMLDAFAAPGHAGVYVLGCFATRVTFFSQQVRALNLVDALCKSGLVCEGQEVAVVGAGASGLTAAAALAVRGARTHVFEQRGAADTQAGRLPIQRSSRQRALHPHLYDWPWGTDPTSSEAGLPVLNWSVGETRSVMESLERQLLAVRERTQDNGVPRIVLHSEGVSPTLRSLARNEGVMLEFNGQQKRFATVILAVGFGVEERSDTGWHSYWADDSLDSFESAQGRWLISGAGDGALTDLLRLSIVNFDHKKVIDSFLKAVPKRTIDDLSELANDRAGTDRSDQFEAAAATFDPELELRTRIQVYLSCTKSQLFGSNTSVLNRLMAASLLRKASGRVQFLARAEAIKTPTLREDSGRYAVKYKSGDLIAEGPFDGVVVRHGPKKALEHGFPEIWEACQPLAERWKATPAKQDWTRKPLWEKRDFSDEAPALLRDFRAEASCAIVASETSRKDPIAPDVSNALLRAREYDKLAFRGQVFNINPIELLVEDAMSSPAAYEHAVRTVCRAQLAVFDLGNNDPATAFLLGIRAVARRGITLVVRRGRLDSESWAELPFNLREISILHRADGDDSFIERFRRALIDGTKLLEALPDTYLDLPVFDGVRRLGARPDIYRAVSSEKQALVLTWFNKEYLSQGGGKAVKRCLGSTLADGCNVLNLMTATSPQLTSQKLYAELRRTDFCVADWTQYRQNVFFELGVRLAVSRLGALNLICRDKTGKIRPVREGKQHQALRALFGPTVFGVNDDKKMWSRIKTHVEQIHTFKKGAQLLAREEASIPDGYTYELVRDSLEHRDEPWSVAVVERLTGAARELLGPDIKTYPESPLLFDDVGKLDGWRAGIELLIGAWYYLDQRKNVAEQFLSGAISTDDPSVVTLLSLSRDIRETLDTLGWRDEAEYSKILASIKTVLATARKRTSGGQP